MDNIFCLHDYHWIWYIIGFTITPRLTLAIIVSVYAPVALWLKLCMWFWGFVCLAIEGKN